VRAVCCALGVSRSHVLTMRDRPSEWTDLRKSPPRSDDIVIKQAIANVVKAAPLTATVASGLACDWKGMTVSTTSGFTG
jgi:hypothetical protein